MAVHAPWRSDGDAKRQDDILRATDRILNDPSIPQAVKDERWRQLRENMSVRSAAKQPDFSDLASVAAAVIREAAASSSDEDVEIIGKRKMSEPKGV